MANGTAHWYAVKSRPGTQRRATLRLRPEEWRQDEFIIERSLRDGGFEVYTPAYRHEIIHHRTRKYIEKRYALLTGYVFVDVPDGNFEAVRRCDGVTDILGYAGSPWRLSTEQIDQLRAAETESEEMFQYRKALRLHRERERSQKIGKRELEARYPPGSIITIAKGHMFEGFPAHVMTATGRKTVKTMIETLNGLVPVELPIAVIEKVA